MYEHEAALIRLGYLTNRDFLVTNQILTLDFNSNFFGKIHEAFGTSGESIWTIEPYATRNGFRVILPTRDVTEWERILRECATRYATNTPATR